MKNFFEIVFGVGYWGPHARSSDHEAPPLHWLCSSVCSKLEKAVGSRFMYVTHCSNVSTGVRSKFFTVQFPKRLSRATIVSKHAEDMVETLLLSILWVLVSNCGRTHTRTTCKLSKRIYSEGSKMDLIDITKWPLCRQHQNAAECWRRVVYDLARDR